MRDSRKFSQGERRSKVISHILQEGEGIRTSIPKILSQVNKAGHYRPASETQLNYDVSLVGPWWPSTDCFGSIIILVIC